ncbi:family 1 glycosylhydrolase [Spirosoma validum]|uniref:Glycoside hydrolase family 1 protein n=1 Tax=Spirosoma validum TaxID=2771355 RepID=A0A927B0M8_9BACT|nr:family 1 glycosylhydrolase [Spirosoma validum]MBD2753077.1 glycoside hydrolase family 1 protein [Spirosoma validum]
MLSKKIKIELWGGIECTVNRVGDVYQDQVKRSGHHDRPEDLDHIAELGIRTLRYPVLWERTAPDHPDSLDWRWADDRITQLRDLGIRPIAGLVHHGCGPRYATFDSPAFVPGLAQYARHVAERYPWLVDYTPVNEPLTTARFAGLYGHWYPHGRSDQQFVRLLLRQIQATMAAMAEIRTVQPKARLIQTDDLSYVHSVPGVQYQADFENERRWLTWDLLCGRVTSDHALWDYLRRSGATEAELWAIAEHACPPSLIGVNHYVTSERYLDEQTPDYPGWMQSTNGRQGYVDTEVVRAAPEKRLGIGKLIEQVWERYGLPIVVTEAHLGDCVDEQKRWLGEIWQQAQAARQDGVDVRAVTVWALFGLYDWHCLLTRQENRYEPGVFNVHSGRVIPTGLDEMIAQLAHGRPVNELIPAGEGWWQVLQEVCLPA